MRTWWPVYDENIQKLNEEMKMMGVMRRSRELRVNGGAARRDGIAGRKP
jgi:hypothetical protein